MLTPEAQKFWDDPDFKRQQELIAGAVPWETSEKNAAVHRTWIETPLIKEYLGSIARTPYVVELGCGVGRMLKEFLKDYHCCGLDISENMLAKAEQYLTQYPSAHKKLLDILTGSIFPLVDRAANFVYSFLVFQHIQTRAEILCYMDEIHRVLVPGGYFRVQTLKGQPHPEELFGGFHGHFYPTLQDFKADLNGHNRFDIVEEEEGLGHPTWLWLTMRKK